MDDLPLFDARPTGGDPTWSVVQLNEAISAALSERFPQEIWVRGEIQGLSRTRMRKHWYFELVEKESFGEGIRGKLSIALLSWNRGGVDRLVAGTPGFDLEDGIEVRIKGRVDYYPPFGKLQFAMTGIDPAFTLGQLALQRERVLAALEAEGLLRANAAHAMPLVPERIGLVTSVGSAAYNDFVNELEQGGYGLMVEVVDARVQGAEAEPTLLAALRTLSRRGCEVVAIVRGGGSQSDLAAFDGEALARAIAAMPVPVITGIGHEIDTSVADLVAHSSFKTPTACAAFLVARTREYLERLDSCWDGIAEYAEECVREESHRLVVAAHRTASRAKSHLLAGERQLEESRRRIAREAPRFLEGRRRALLVRGGELRAALRLSLLRQEERLRRATAGLSPARLDARLQRPGERLARAALALGRRPSRSLTRLEGILRSHEARVRALDPARVLARGYSLTRDAQGRLLRDSAGLREGQEIITRLAKGSVHSRVASTSEESEAR